MSDSNASSEQLEIFPIESPCVGVCQSGDNGFCKGCGRSRDERLHWLSLDDPIKRKILVACARRLRRRGTKKRQDIEVTDSPQQSLF